ncbi:MAG: hypothetical protein D6702_12060 [Planctomycetota bacterium]|nr:MAG: hypothetical protein D6702_12060 [Planctomycetota bacterium]
MIVTALCLGLAGGGGLPPAGPEPVRLRTRDGIELHAWYLHAGDRPGDDERARAEAAAAPALVLLPMYRGAKEDWTPLLGALHERGIAALALDPRGHGESRTGPDGEDLAARVAARDPELFRAMWRDAAAGVDWLVARGHRPERIGLLGASVGCSVAIDAARRDPRLRVVGTLTPGRNYLGVPTLEHLRDWGDRRLLVVAGGDEWANGAGPIVAALAGRDGSSVTFWRLPERGVHGTRMFGRVAGIENRLAAWFAAALAGPAAPEDRR